MTTFGTDLITASFLLLGQATVLLGGAALEYWRHCDGLRRRVCDVQQQVCAATIPPPVGVMGAAR